MSTTKPDDGSEVVVKSYDQPEHARIGNMILAQLTYLKQTLRDPDDPDIFARLSGDTLSMVLMELTAMYEGLSKWIADENLHVADAKTEYELSIAEAYVKFKNMPSETNETARMKARLFCRDKEEELNKIKASYKKVEMWKKTIGRYHDAVRSQLSYEKSMGTMSR